MAPGRYGYPGRQGWPHISMPTVRRRLAECLKLRRTTLYNPFPKLSGNVPFAYRRASAALTALCITIQWVLIAVADLEVRIRELGEP